jgi:hypothetical protein
MVDWVAPAAAVAGILLGGGLRAVQSWWERRLEASAVLSALVAEVDSIKRLINHRQYIRHLVETANHCRDLVHSGNGRELVPPVMIPVGENYFQIFDQLAAEIGKLTPYHADRIVRFYSLAKAAKENFAPTSPWVKQPVAAEDLLQVLENDIEVLRVVFLLGDKIAGFVDRKPPRGVIDTMLTEDPSGLLPDPLAFASDRRLSSPTNPPEQGA